MHEAMAMASTPRIISTAPTMLGTLTSTQQKGPIRLTVPQSIEAALAQHYYLPHPPFQTHSILLWAHIHIE
jgi:hypothetical protein